MVAEIKERDRFFMFEAVVAKADIANSYRFVWQQPARIQIGAVGFFFCGKAAKADMPVAVCNIGTVVGAAIFLYRPENSW